MSKFNCKITTQVGEFTRKATKPYSHAVVRTSPRAMGAFERAQAGHKSGSNVNQRWAKDRGFAVTWHGSEAAARKAAAAPYIWDLSTQVVGIFAVEVL